MKTTSEIERITTLLANSFSGPHPWYGSPVMETLKGITATQATKKLSDNTHAIIELVLHMTSWRTFVVMKLRRIEFEMTEDLNFPKSSDWKEALVKLQQSQIDLLAALHAFPVEKLSDIVPNRKYDFYTLLHGIIEHDVYHLGQIALIKKGTSK